MSYFPLPSPNDPHVFPRSTRKRLAVDVGGVIVTKDDHIKDAQEDTVFDPSNARFEPGVREALAELSKHFELYIISFAGRTRAENTQVLLMAHGFDALIPPARWFFVKNRKHKAPLMQFFGIRALIDDTDAVVFSVRTARLVCFHYGPSAPVGAPHTLPTWAHVNAAQMLQVVS